MDLGGKARSKFQEAITQKRGAEYFSHRVSLLVNVSVIARYACRRTNTMENTFTLRILASQRRPRPGCFGQAFGQSGLQQRPSRHRTVGAASINARPQGGRYAQNRINALANVRYASHHPS